MRGARGLRVPRLPAALPGVFRPRRALDLRAAPELDDGLYDDDSGARRASRPYMVTEFEPVFDAADFIRCGRDIFVSGANVTNRSASPGCGATSAGVPHPRVRDPLPQPMHIDATFVPLAPGKLLVNPDTSRRAPPRRCSSRGTSSSRRGPTRPGHLPPLHVQQVDQHERADARRERVVVEETEPPDPRLRGLGLRPILCPFMLLPVRRLLPLRHAGHAPAGRACGRIFRGDTSTPVIPGNAEGMNPEPTIKLHASHRSWVPGSRFASPGMTSAARTSGTISREGC